MNAPAYNFAYLDEQTKRMIRRAILKAIAIPGYQVPFASREMPMPYGWGTGGVQVTAAILGPGRRPQGDRPGLRRHHQRGVDPEFFAKTAGVRTTTDTRAATVIQTRHRIPEATLSENQVLVYQVPIPEPLRFLEPRETETRRMHALAEYGLMHVKLYEDIARHGHIATTYAYPVKVDGRYVMDPSPTPKFDNPKMNGCAALQLFGAGREKRIYAIPPHTQVVSLDFDDHPFERYRYDAPCELCGATDSFLDEVITDDGAAGCSSVPTRIIASRGAPRHRPRPPAPRRLAVNNEALTIRPASSADLPGVLELYAQPEIDDGDVLSLDEAAQLHSRFSRYPDYTLYVAEQSGVIVGSFALLVMDNLGHLGAPSAIVEDVVVAPALHGRGIGQAMMRFALERSREKGCYKLMLSSNAKRERAHAFYETLGFDRHGFSFRVDIPEVAA